MRKAYCSGSPGLSYVIAKEKLIVNTVSIVIGTRPEAIKMAPVYLELKKIPNLKVMLIATGQHRELLWPSA
ncbi:MAG: hypothetical protein EOP11_25860 [Proteobacteria bacterium]|nr:MAG: hypothetical protein EOP11_25860 [Pseudomonadota bacterium]